jgi:NAD(P)-dependent dehydrogenase (short-subunit alcohol dehydrogenase family)
MKGDGRGWRNHRVRRAKKREEVSERKVALITGAAQGIGRGCAEVFARSGWRVALAEVNAEKGRTAQGEMAANGWDARFIECDVRNEDSVDAAVEATVVRFGRLDCVVNNAGTHPAEGHVDKVPPAEFEALIRMNVTSAYIVVRSALRDLRKTRGSIVSIASMAGVLGQGGAVAYSTSKAALIGMTRALAIDLAPEGIRVNAICPAGVDTPMIHEWARGLDDYEGVIAHQRSMHKLGRLATIQEIGNVCFFLGSEASSFMTGQAIIVDGGVSIGY